jgi:hypothetical protein
MCLCAGRYHIAYLSSVRFTLNVLQHQLHSSPVHSTKVCDGVSIGFRLSLCHIQRPWLIPHDVESVKDKVQQCFPNQSGSLYGMINKHMLFQGGMLNKYTMIPAAAIRDIVSKLADTKNPGVPLGKGRALNDWLVLEPNKPLIPYIKTIQASNVCISLHSLRSSLHSLRLGALSRWIVDHYCNKPCLITPHPDCVVGRRETVSIWILMSMQSGM